MAKSIHEPFENDKIGKEYYVQFTEDPPSIDGFLDDECWAKSVPIMDFIQEEPNNMDMVTEKTLVYITYDSKSLYVAARLHDSNPDLIVKQLAPHDDWYGAFDEVSDWFSIDLDSRHDHQTAFSFAVNASGVRSDEMIYHDNSFDGDWNAIWQAEVSIDDLGWIVEIEIPFSNLPFYESDEMEWGLNLTRFIQRKHELSRWVVFPLETEGVVSKFGHLVGLKDIFPPSKYEFKPFFKSGFANYSDIRLINFERPNSHDNNFQDVFNYDFGLDFLYRISPNSKLVYAINPDYGQIEADPSNINLTAFETYFQEKRQFFLKDVDIFDTPIEFFYSRRIGEKAWGEGVMVVPDTLRYNGNVSLCTSQGGSMIGIHCIGYDTLYSDIPITIKGAGKLIGRTESGFSYGLLAAVTTLNDSSNWFKQVNKGKNRSYFVSRFKQDLFSGNSFLGFMSTSSFKDSSHVFSVDFMGNFIDNQLSLDGQFIRDGKNNTNGAYIGVSFVPEGNLSGWLDYYQFDEKINFNYLGYLWRDDYTQTKYGIKFESYEPWSIVDNFYVLLESDVEKNSNGMDLGKAIDIRSNFEFINYWNVGGGIYKIFEHFDDRKIIYDYENNKYGPRVKIPEIIGSHFNISSDKYGQFWTTMSLTWADNERNDKERGKYIEINYKPNSYVTFSTSYDRYELSKKYHWIESLYEHDGYHHIFSDLDKKLDIFTFKTLFNVNRKLSVQGYLEIFANNDIFSSYSEYDHDKLENEGYDYDSDYILGNGSWSEENGFGSVYTNDISKLDNSYLDPNSYIGLYSKYTSFVFNGIIKWNYVKGSNIYFVFSHNKSVNGLPFDGLNGIKDFMSFNKEEDWVEVLRDQTFMIKIDYWFEK